MHTVIAFESSITNGSTYAQILGALDQSISYDASNRFIMPDNMRLLAAYLMGVNITAGRINAPSLRQMVLPQIYPGNPAATVPSGGEVMNFYGRGPSFVKNETVEVDVSRGGASAQPCWAGLWIAPALTQARDGPVYTLPFTCSVTTVVGTWVLAALTPEQSLPAGRYAVVGMAALAAGVVFARLVFPGVSNYRPGCLANAAYGDTTLGDPFRMGRFGSFGEFESTAIPAVEVIGDAAAAITATIHLDLVKMR